MSTQTKRVSKVPSGVLTDLHEVIGLTPHEEEISRAVWQSLVPDAVWYDTYVSRKVRGFLDLDIISTSVDLHHNIALRGPTGPGKTHLFRAWGAREGKAVATIDCNGASDPSLWWGDYRYLRGEWVWVDGLVTAASRWGGLVHWSEINFARPEIISAAYSWFREREVILEKKGNEVIKTADDCIGVASYNPGYGGVNELSEALVNRFAQHIEWDYDPRVEKRLVNDATLLRVAEQLRQAYTEGIVETPTSTNALIEFETIAVSFDVPYAIENFVARFAPEERPTVTNILDLASLRDKFVAPATKEA